MDGRAPFAIEVLQPYDGWTVVVLEGELDIFTSPRLSEAVRRSIDDGARQVVVDLTQVTFVDSTALSVIVEVVKRLRSLGGVASVVCNSAHVRRVFQITGLDRIVGIYPTREQALRLAQAL
jgi:anti-sigma B factor antagonist